MPSKMLRRAQAAAVGGKLAGGLSSGLDGKDPAGATTAPEASGEGLFEQLPAIPGATVWRPTGSLDASSCASLAEAFERNISTEVTALVDFSRVENVGPAGLGMLVALQKRQRMGGGELVLQGLRPKLRRFLDSMGYGSFFSIALDQRRAAEYILGVRRDVFPRAAVCPACSSKLGLEGPGRSRCRACKAVLTVLPDGTVELG